MISGRQLTRAKLTDGHPPARIVALPLGDERWVSAYAVEGAPWDDVPGQHGSASEAVAAAVREIERRLAVARSACCG